MENEEVLEKTVPRSQYLRLIPTKYNNESFYLSIVSGIFGDEIKSKFNPVSPYTWLKILRIYLHKK